MYLTARRNNTSHGTLIRELLSPTSLSFSVLLFPCLRCVPLSLSINLSLTPCTPAMAPVLLQFVSTHKQQLWYILLPREPLLTWKKLV